MSDGEYMRRVRALEGRLYRVAQAMLWRRRGFTRPGAGCARFGTVRSADRRGQKPCPVCMAEKK